MRAGHVELHLGAGTDVALLSAAEDVGGQADGLDIVRASSAGREAEVDLILPEEDVIDEVDKAFEPQFAIEVDADNLRVRIPRHAALVVFAVLDVGVKGISLHRTCDGGGRIVVHAAVGDHRDVGTRRGPIIAVLPGVEFHGKGRLEIGPEEA